MWTEETVSEGVRASMMTAFFSGIASALSLAVIYTEPDLNKFLYISDRKIYFKNLPFKIIDSRNL